jgi:hypothetical protein
LKTRLCRNIQETEKAQSRNRIETEEIFLKKVRKQGKDREETEQKRAGTDQI